MAKIIHRITQPSGWSALNELQQSINQLFDPLHTNASSEFACDWSPTIDIKDQPKQYIIQADIPGVDPKNIDIHMENGRLIIKGEKETKHEENTENYVRVERSRGSFLRWVALPEMVESKKIRAKCKDGVLEIIIPKSHGNSGHKIPIES